MRTMQTLSVDEWLIVWMVRHDINDYRRRHAEHGHCSAEQMSTFREIQNDLGNEDYGEWCRKFLEFYNGKRPNTR